MSPQFSPEPCSLLIASILGPLTENCLRCGYISSNDLCKACALLEGLEQGLDKSAIVSRSSALQLPKPPFNETRSCRKPTRKGQHRRPPAKERYHSIIARPRRKQRSPFDQNWSKLYARHGSSWATLYHVLRPSGTWTNLRVVLRMH